MKKFDNKKHLVVFLAIILTIGLMVAFWQYNNGGFGNPVATNEFTLETEDHMPPAQLRGKLTTELRYGPPNYGENPESDQEIYPYFLVLNKPIMVNDQSYTKVQVAFTDTLSKDEIKALKNEQIVINGKLYKSHTGHHYTDYLISVDDAEKEKN